MNLFPPTALVPDGFYPLIRGEPYALDEQNPLQQTSFVAGSPERGFVEPTAVGRTLFKTPLLLTTEMYVEVP